MTTETETRHRIVLSALELFLTHGIKKTTVDEVAQQAGVTRVTVYRYFNDKKDIVRASFMHMLAVMQGALAELAREQDNDITWYTERIGKALGALPRGDLPARIDELKRLYPDILAEFRQTRLETFREIYHHVFAAAKRSGLLQANLKWEIVEAIFVEATFTVLESPLILSQGVSPGDIYSTFMDILLYGILKKKKKGEKNGNLKGVG
jgi:AcrR family transcriptional regulator